MTFSYTKEWYGGEYVEPWIGCVKSVEALRAEYVRQERYRLRLSKWFEGQELSGLSLELGFNDGKSVHWLSKLFPELVFDLLDWNEALQQIEPFIREITPVRYVFYGDVLNTPFTGAYENIFSLDFFEHVPLPIYLQAVELCESLLVPGGRLWVYFGATRMREHINLRRLEDIHEDLASLFPTVTLKDDLFCATKSSSSIPTD